MKVAMKTLDLGRQGIASLSVGVAQRAVDECVKYLRAKFPDPKVQPGQAVQFKLADMEIQTQAARQMLHHTLAMKDAGVPITKESAITKTFCGDTAMRVTRDALEILGAHGYSTDCAVEKLVRDAKIMQIYEGTNQIQRLVVSRAVLSEPAAAKKPEDKTKTTTTMRGAA